MASGQEKMIGNLRPRLKFDLTDEGEKRAFDWVNKVGPQLSSEVIVKALVFASEKISTDLQWGEMETVKGNSISLLGEKEDEE